MKGKKPPDHTFQLNCRNREAAALLNISALQRLFQAPVWLPAHSKNIFDNNKEKLLTRITAGCNIKQTYE
jgi:hypothetical protein